MQTARVLVSLGMWVAVLGCSGIQPLSESKRSPRFERVLQNLDLGGTLFGYMDVEGDVERLGEYVQELLDLASRLSDEVQLQIDVKALVARLGFNNIDAVGISSYKDGQVYRNKTFVHLSGDRRGLMKIPGGPPQPFGVVRLAPDDADLVFERDLNLRVILDVVVDILRQVKGEAADQLLAKLEEPLPGLSVTYRQIIDRLDTRLTGIVRIDENKQISLPGVELSVPYVAFYLAMDDMTILFDALTKKAKSISVLKHEKDERFETLALMVPLPNGFGAYQPLLVKELGSGRLGLVSSREFLTQLYAPEKKLAGATAFRQATVGLPVQGNGLSYVSPALGNKIGTLLDGIAKAYPDARLSLELLKGFLPEPGISMASVSVNLADGILFVSNSQNSHKTTLAALVYVNPAVMGILAAVAVPAFINYTRKAKVSEVHQQLDLCYRAVVDTHDRNRQNKAGLPPSTPMVCPRHTQGQDGLNGESGPLDYGDARERFEELGWVTRENVFGCYRYERVAQPGNQVGIAFVCHAWTDIDDDDQVAHWTKTARWDVEIETFRGSAVNGEGDEF